MQEEQGKKIGLWNIVGLGLGGAIGTGIFVMLGYGIAYTGRSIMLVCAAGCFWMLLAYWYNVAIPNVFVLKGGDYSMKALLMNPLMTGFSAWLTVAMSLEITGYAIVIADFLQVLWPEAEIYKQWISLAILILFFAATIRGSRFITLLENAITIVLIAAIILFVAFGLPRVNPITFFSNADGDFWHGGFKGFISAVAVMGYACQGSTMAPVGMAAVTKKPKLTIPKGILITNCLLALIYGLMGYVACGILPYDQIAGQNISVTAKAIFPASLFIFFVVGGGIGAVSSSMVGALAQYRYPLMQIAQDGWLPNIFRKTTKSGYPYMTYALFFLCGLIPIFLNMSVDIVVSLVMIPTMIINVYMNFACLFLPEKFPEQWERRSLKTSRWFYAICCVLGCIAAAVVSIQLLLDLTVRDAVIAVILVVLMLILPYIRLKQGGVKKEYLDKQKEDIYALALQDDEE